ncbi:hypothetical protein K431DRAFT_215122 [Polychaeton citri CBS 116435]|uniref:Carboxymuconolactone decarboxylase-like domain-containing protein n=1 Tax=Polychaeton citri CBS 116435 TaxID=1314669 RepID=A0A9P4QG15_9PEZI|nr:hypothetical protein K431DRAFT_215122 [Polychaeton citri CBS 116435]
MRLQYIDDEPRMPDKASQDVVERVKERRGGKLIALDKSLLHAPPIADGWNSFIGSIRSRNSIPDSIRELCMCRVAVLNQAWYEWHSHSPLLEKTGVLSTEAIEYIKTRPKPGLSDKGAVEDGGSGEKLMDEKHLAVLEYTDAMTIGCVVPQPVFNKLKALFSDREVVEITTTVAAYNCVSRFLVALDVGEMAEKYGIDMS